MLSHAVLESKKLGLVPFKFWIQNNPRKKSTGLKILRTANISFLMTTGEKKISGTWPVWQDPSSEVDFFHSFSWQNN